MINTGHNHDSSGFCCALIHFYLNWINSRTEFNNGRIIISRLEQKGKRNKEKENLIFTAYYLGLWGSQVLAWHFQIISFTLSTTPWCTCYPYFTVQETQVSSAEWLARQSKSSNSSLFNPKFLILNIYHITFSYTEVCKIGIFFPLNKKMPHIIPPRKCIIACLIM